jgi:hypothetical protein
MSLRDAGRSEPEFSTASSQNQPNFRCQSPSSRASKRTAPPNRLLPIEESDSQPQNVDGFFRKISLFFQ